MISEQDARFILSCKLAKYTVSLVRTDSGVQVKNSPFVLSLSIDLTTGSQELIVGEFGDGIVLVAYADTGVTCFRNGELIASRSPR